VPDADGETSGGAPLVGARASLPTAGAPEPSIGRTVAALGVFLLGMLAGAPLVLFRDDWPTGVWLFFVSVPGEALGLVGALLVARWPIARLREQCAVPRGSVPALIVTAFGCLLITAAGLWLGRRLVPFEGPDALMREVASLGDPLDLALVGFAIVVFGPIAEELLLRGIVLRGFAVNWGVAAGVAVNALLFAVLHLNPVQGMLGIVTGTVFALAVLRTGSLGPGMLMHVVINANALVAVLAAGGPSAEDAAESPPLVLVIALGAIGLALVRFGLRQLPRDPARLARLWGLPPPPSVRA
jgi:membrane protease YdiL (CAAX protease family)